jgi:hypothetical protein
MWLGIESLVVTAVVSRIAVVIVVVVVVAGVRWYRIGVDYLVLLVFCVCGCCWFGCDFLLIRCRLPIRFIGDRALRAILACALPLIGAENWLQAIRAF